MRCVCHLLLTKKCWILNSYTKFCNCTIMDVAKGHLGHGRQWCSRDRNLQNRDRDLVKISRRDWDFIKNSETQSRDLKCETETRGFKICAFCRNFSKIVVITSDHRRLQGETGISPHLDWSQTPRFSRTHEVSSLIPINWFNFCDATIFSGMTLSHSHCTTAKFTAEMITQPEWTPAGVCILICSRCRIQSFKFEPEPESTLRSITEKFSC